MLLQHVKVSFMILLDFDQFVVCFFHSDSNRFVLKKSLMFNY